MKTLALSMVLLAPGAYAQFGSAANAFNSAVDEATAGAAPSVVSGTYALCHLAPSGREDGWMDVGVGE